MKTFDKNFQFGTGFFRYRIIPKFLLLMILAFIPYVNIKAQKDIILNGSTSGLIKSRESITMISDFETTEGDFIIDEDMYIPPVLTPTGGGDLNYIYSRVLRKEITDTSQIDTLSMRDINQQVQYFDGLGRPIQTVSIAASPDKNDIVSPIVYDQFGRESEKYLSYPVDGSGQYQSDAITNLKTWYNSASITRPADNRPFTEITYDNSPLNRILYQLGPGEAWKSAGKKTEFKYDTNIATDVILWEVKGSSCKYKNHYAAGELYKNTVVDENGNATVEFIDKQGQKILKTGEEGTKAYYVYDDFGLLRFVIPPKAVEANGEKDLDKSILKNLCYYYEYDSRKRMILKKLPGAGSVTMKYDDRDRLIETQDSMQRSRGEVAFITYDELNRPVRTGVRYSNNKSDTLTYTFYDDYSFISALKLNINYSDESKYNTNVTDKVKVRVTGTRSKILGENKFITSVNYYDKYGRVVQTQSINQFGQIDKVTSQYHFWGGVEKTMQRHKFDASHELTIEQKFQYDHTGRLLSTSESVNGANPVIIAKMTYDELGQLASKELNASSSKPLQKIDYTYNIRGWLTGINPSFNSDEKDLFVLNLYYNDTTGVGPLKGKPQYNGNISSLKWRSNHEVESNYMYQAYGFNYDKLNRLTSSKYGITNSSGVFPDEYMNRYNEENLKYDSNGNLLNLSRTGAYKDGNSLRYGQMDSLKYRYFSNSNQLMSIADNSSVTGYGYNDLNNDTTDFAYDGNGNLTRYKDKKIKSIEYNYLNLPKKITFDDSDSIVYIYDANGVKHLKKFFENGKQKNAEYYIGNIIYETDSTGVTADKLRFVMNSEGHLLRLKNGSFRAEYFLKDHLGNTRVVFADTLGNGTPSIIQETNYYPFGLAFTGVDLKTDKNKFLYNGKELQVDDDLGMYDYGARFYDPQIGRFHRVDPAAEKYPNILPYTYCANNPIIYIDPTGMYIEEGSQKEWERRKSDVTSQRDYLQKRVDKLTTKAGAKGWSGEKLASKIGDKSERIASLNSSLGTMGTLESSTQGYSLSIAAPGENGGITLNTETKIIDIKFGNTANFVHEVTHAGQFESRWGHIAFDSKTGGVLGQDVYDEVQGYRAQYAYDLSSVSGLASTSKINSVHDILPQWVQGLGGGKLYVPGGGANTGISPLYINSTRADFINAYPGIPAMRTLPANFVLKTSYPNIYYKK